MFLVKFSLGDASLPSSETSLSRLIVMVSFGRIGRGGGGGGRGRTLLDVAPSGATLSLCSVCRPPSSSLSWLETATTVVVGGKAGAAVCVLTLDLLISTLL